MTYNSSNHQMFLETTWGPLAKPDVVLSF